MAAFPAALEDPGISVIRGLAMDAPHQARSGHQGTAMAMAPLAHVLWTRILRYDADDPAWPDRDRFVLSAGHASILLYSMLHLSGQGLTLDDLRDFRQWDSRTPGHPEVGRTAGVEVTTGPLGQGIANALGMAVAERWLRHRFGADVCDHRVFALCSDGDLSEGISHEASSLAGHQRLDRLICFYDDNRITIDGPTDLSLSDDAAQRFAAYGWHVLNLGEAADDLDALEAGIRTAMAVDDAPSLIIVRSHVAYPSPGQTDNHEAHGYSLFDDEIAATKTVMGLPADESFYVPADVGNAYRAAGRRGALERSAWQQRVEALGSRRSEYEACLAGRGLPGWENKLPSWSAGESVATRKASSRLSQRHGRRRPRPGCRRGRPHRQHWHQPGQRRSAQLRPSRRPTDLLRHTRARHGRGAETGPPCTAGCCPWAGPSWCSATTCGPPFAWPRCRRPTPCSCGATTR